MNSTFEARVGYLAGVFFCFVGGVAFAIGDWPFGVVMLVVGIATMAIVRKGT